ncbi:hypothetical protein ACO3VM_09425 (plasmid) [Methanocaldococcus sp. 10A]
MITKITHAHELTLDNKTTELSTYNCLGIFLNARITVSNSDAKDATVKVEDILNKIKFNVRKNNTTSLIEIDAFTLALFNIFDANSYFNVDANVKIPKEAQQDIIVPLYVDGPFRAEDYNDFDISMTVNQKVNDVVSISDIAVEVTGVYTDEKIDDSIIERTKKVFKKEFASGSYQEVVRINTTNAVQQGIIIFRDKNGVRTDNIKKIGLRVIEKTSTDILMESYASAKMIGKLQHNPKIMPKGVLFIDFRNEVTSDYYGIKMWRLNKDEKLFFAVESDIEGTIEVVTKELVVRPELIDKTKEETTIIPPSPEELDYNLNYMNMG